MKIEEGPLVSLSKGDVEDLLDTPTDMCTWKLSHGDQHVLCVSMHYCTFYYLIRSNFNVSAAIKTRRGVMSDFADALLGYICVDHKDLDTVDRVWLTRSMRGKGYGQGMYRLAHQFSARGIRSSTDLGTMSLATLIRLYRNENDVRLMYEGREVPRNEVKINGANILFGESNLCSPKSGDFQFVWTKS
jgi:hypothetical protein